MVLNGYTSIENASEIDTTSLEITIQTTKDNRTVFQVDTSDKSFDDLNGQIRDTITYLKENRIALEKIKETLTDLSWHIDFGYTPKIVNGEMAVENLLIPLDLTKLCSDLEIEINISLYDGRTYESE